MKKKIFIYMSITSIAVLIICFFVYSLILDHAFVKNKKEDAKLILKIASLAKVEDLKPALKDSNMRLSIIDLDGKVIYDSSVAAVKLKNHADREEFKLARDYNFGQYSRLSKTLSKKYCYLAQRKGNLIYRISFSRDSVLYIFYSMINPILSLIALLLILVFILSNKLSREIVKPLNEFNFNNRSYPELIPMLTELERQRAKNNFISEKLERERENFRSLTDNLSEALVLFDENLEISSANRAAKKIFKIAAFKDRDHEVMTDVYVLNLVKRALCAEVIETEFERDAAFYELKVFPIYEGEIIGAMLLAEEITEKKRREQRRREFSANVSHQLKTPLQSIMGFAELLENDMVREEDKKEFYTKILKKSKEMLKMIEKILMISKLDEMEEKELKEIRVDELLREVSFEFLQISKEKDIRMIIELKPLEILGDYELLKEAFTNLIENSIKYNKIGGIVEIKSEKNIVTIYDTGIGIKREYLPRVTERFFRADETHAGNGLGLAIAQKAFMANSASLKIESEENKFTKFTIEFKNLI